MDVRMKKYWAFLMVMIICMCSVQVVGAEEENQTSEKRVVKVGYYSTPGFQEYDENTGVYSGYSYEYMLALAEYADWEYEFIPVTFADGVKMLENGELDLMNNVSRTQEREEYLSYSNSPSGSNCAYLAVASDNKNYAYEDFESFNQLTVGLVTTSIYSDKFLQYCQENEFTPNIRYYDTKELAIAALESGEIDARIITSSQNIDMHIIAKFAPEDFYFAVPIQQKDLFRELNQAMSSLKTNDPDFEVRLEKKYYSNVVDDNTVLTKEEEKFIKETEKITVAYDKDCYPLSYTDENGNFAGTIYQIYKIIEERIGVNFTFVEASASSLGQLSQGDGTMIYAELPYDYIWAEQYQVRLTPPFMDMTVVEARRDDFDGSGKVIALVEGYYLSDVCRENYGDTYEYKMYPNTRACLDAVRKKEADITCLTSYEGEAYQSDFKYRSLAFSVAQKMNYSISVGVSKDSNSCLFSIMMKGLNAVSADEIDTLFRETALEVQQADTMTIISKHPEMLVTIAILAAFLIAGIIFFILYSRTMKKKNAEINLKNSQLAEAVVQADRASVAKSQFLSQMSHEIRTPMNAIVGLTSIAKQHEEEPQRVDEYLNKIETSSKVLLNIINDILDMSAIESNKLKIENAVFDIRKVISGISTIYLPQCEGKGIDFEVTEQMEDYSLMGDSLRVNQILLNLVSNAYKFTDAGGKIQVEIKETAKRDSKAFVRFTVSDTGCGMSPDMMERLFKPFEQETVGTAKKHGGSGLGLSITKNLIDMMHGAIKVKSEKGKGTTFVVDLPFGVPNQQEKEMQESTQNIENETQEKKMDFTGRKLLLAEDNEMNAEIAIELLHMVKFEVERAADGEKALEMFEKSSPGTYALILMDVQMPVMNGYEATKAIRALKREDAVKIPILAMTADAFTEDISAALSAGMNGHISKPIDTDALYKTLWETVEKLKQKTRS